MERVFAPASVWETVAIDFNGPYTKFNDILILVIVDYRSRYIIAKPVPSTSFENTRSVLDEVCDREGYPKHIKSDNGPPYNGEGYKDYCREHDILTIFSTPLYPQQNGLVEGCMKLVNNAMTAAATNGKSYKAELKAAIHAYNAAAHSVTGDDGPEEVMMGRKIKRGLPLLCRGKTTFNDELLNSKDRESKRQAKEREDAKRGARVCRVGPGDTVVVERHGRAKAESRFDPRKYTVLEERNSMLVLIDENGQIWKRHVSQTKKVSEWRVPDKMNSAAGSSSGEQIRERSPVQKLSRQPGETQRTTRDRRKPSYLENYVHNVEQETTQDLNVCFI
ncbi:uncharacterized protein K02A2.6-like [Wyeomyia smithii]|uniref:uncharacterized protein K02A2.6-like n=1 Tax=Wyeomyia smithii TaxID=174621 RepID=UPI002467CEDA|nr:uncharacterized protein K02A2.6-like [Wyeomyia smithii]